MVCTTHHEERAHLHGAHKAFPSTEFVGYHKIQYAVSGGGLFSPVYPTKKHGLLRLTAEASERRWSWSSLIESAKV
jgi:hypothetical protein